MSGGILNCFTLTRTYVVTNPDGPLSKVVLSEGLRILLANKCAHLCLLFNEFCLYPFTIYKIRMTKCQ